MLSIACLLFPISPVSSFVALSSVSTVQYPLPISVLSLFTQKWFNVLLKLSKAINTQFVMKPAELKMELLILLSLLSLLFFLLYALRYLLFFLIVPSFSFSGTILVNPPPFWTPPRPLVVCVLWVLCCSSNKNRD